jgi:hypothetical protein
VLNIDEKARSAGLFFARFLILPTFREIYELYNLDGFRVGFDRGRLRSNAFSTHLAAHDCNDGSIT